MAIATDKSCWGAVELIDLFREFERHWYYGRVEAYTATMEKIRQAIASYDAAATQG